MVRIVFNCVSASHTNGILFRILRNYTSSCVLGAVRLCYIHSVIFPERKICKLCVSVVKCSSDIPIKVKLPMQAQFPFGNHVGKIFQGLDCPCVLLTIDQKTRDVKYFFLQDIRRHFNRKNPL